MAKQPASVFTAPIEPASSSGPEDFTQPGFVKATERMGAPPTIDPTGIFPEPIDAMADAPLDGRLIEVTPDGEKWEPARWYQTRVRKCVNDRLQWVPEAYWVIGDAFMARRKLGFNPIGWRRAP